MKKYIVFVILLLIIAALIVWYIESTGKKKLQQYEKEKQEHLASIEELKKLLKESEQNVDTLWLEIEKEVFIRDTIWKEYPLLPPDQIVDEFNRFTGPGTISQLTSDTTALVPIPRILDATIQMAQGASYKRETMLLRGVVAEKNNQLKIASKIDKEKDGIIDLQETEIENRGAMIKKKELEIWITRGVAGVLLLVLIAK